MSRPLMRQLSKIQTISDAELDRVAGGAEEFADGTVCEDPNSTTIDSSNRPTDRDWIRDNN